MRCSIFIVCLMYLTLEIEGFSKDSLSILMSGVRPDKPETYLCLQIQIDSSFTSYIVGYTPNATMQVVHHMLLYGCTEPGSTEEMWNCGGMNHQHGLHSSGPCKTGQHILYAWAKDAPSLDLPEGVAFRIGGDTDINYLTLQVHYADVSSFKDGNSDSSGVFVHYTKTKMPKTAGVFLLGTSGHIPAHKTEHMETACRMSEDKEMHPFAFRTHTHTLGRVVSGYRLQRDNAGVDHWTLIGKKNPQLSQMFYPVFNNITVKKDDILAARCTMVNEKSSSTEVGSSNEHEMCNYYIMYWVDGPDLLEVDDCFTAGPPTYYWNKDTKLNINNIPDDTEVSSVSISSSSL